jgi:hypothetical protein
MLSDMAAAFTGEPAETGNQNAIGAWAEMALTVMFTLVAVLFVSFLAVVTGLV